MSLGHSALGSPKGGSGDYHWPVHCLPFVTRPPSHPAPMPLGATGKGAGQGRAQHGPPARQPSQGLGSGQSTTPPTHSPGPRWPTLRQPQGTAGGWREPRVPTGLNGHRNPQVTETTNTAQFGQRPAEGPVPMRGPAPGASAGTRQEASAPLSRGAHDLQGGHAHTGVKRGRCGCPRGTERPPQTQLCFQSQRSAPTPRYGRRRQRPLQK